ncbi:MAG: replicative DNA helicase [Flavobacteriales bacterium]|jgi:replicative DNA helicase|uniref:replicative DNA helicase n=1 Tax=Blattabacterium sp. (Mastotermes darwiniensis) TaxID=39768 RepID=UPI000231DEB8|nr:replicative DNA helicase [Blattabacterium sp. (Mastotermes darwiniensis)]AER40748.1 replicative DNA helicase [Blattabacterium sp. (Mastotermes darwiniensis) str. MADAR]MDR1805131.1 replicative DNA helicase [Flavobacteriales bacterium]
MKKMNNITEKDRNFRYDFIKNGKIPPQALDLEEAIIGSMMIDKKGLDEIIDILFPEVFYKIEHQEIFRSIQKLYHNSKPVDLYTVSNQLRKDEKLEFIGSELYLIELTQKVISSAHIEYHSRIVQQKFLLRRLISISSEIIENCYDESTDVFELLDKAESKLFEINQKYLKEKKYETTQSLIMKAIDRIKKVESNKEGWSGIYSGFYKMDKITYGWQNSDLIILASRPGMGKTTFMLSMVRNIVIEQKIPVVIFSLEMSSIQLITRLIASETGISSEKLKKASLSNLDWKRIFHKTKKLKEAPLFIDDTPALSIFSLRAKCRRLISKHGIKLVLIDYMQLMGISDSGYNNKSRNREQEISIISRSLKSIAKELDIPIIALSQLSRAVETRGGSRRPLLSDLRESGAIEQDADIVLFIYRPEYYGFHTWDTEEKDSCIGQAEIIIAKHRNGGLGKVRLRFISDQVKFMDFEEKKISSSGWEEDYKKNILDQESFFIETIDEDNDYLSE